ncbi:MAG: hypothetical protein DMG68_10180 [Acidobacteria bacterium]|nr:MAG: hypothetical protein DMG68_10180 [Acidobacteriota bacterium]
MLVKTKLTSHAMAAQSANALPARQLLTLVRITNVLNNNHITVTVANNQIAVQVCAVVQAINALFAAQCAHLTCKIVL